MTGALGVVYGVAGWLVDAAASPTALTARTSIGYEVPFVSGVVPFVESVVI
jgi:hypothetical protein